MILCENAGKNKLENTIRIYLNLIRANQDFKEKFKNFKY